MLTQKELKDILNYSLETGVFTWKVNMSQSVKAGHIAGTLEAKGYIRIGVQGKYTRAHRLAWLYVYGYLPKGFLDHIDGNPSNNRIGNLRECTNNENMKNRKIDRSNTSGYKGVSWHKHRCMWVARAMLNKKSYSLGYFDTPEKASAVYQEFTKLHHGEFYRDTTGVPE